MPIYFARLRVKGKLIRRSLKTSSLSVAKLRLSDFEKTEQQMAQSVDAVASGKMTFGDARAVFQSRMQTSPALKPRTKEYCAYRVSALLKSWPGLKEKDVSRIPPSLAHYACELGKIHCGRWRCPMKPTQDKPAVKITDPIFQK